jgi:hypothetical protein
MLKSENAFDWQGKPSIWMRDKELKQIAAGQALGVASRERISLTEKKQVNIYSKAKQSNKGDKHG